MFTIVTSASMHVCVSCMTTFFYRFRGNVVVVALTVRDCYEAFVVYSFLTLILEHAGGDYNCIEQIKHLPPVSFFFFAFFCFIDVHM